MTDTRLLDSVDAGKRPIVEHIRQKTDLGIFIRTHTVMHPPLLE